MKYTTETLKNPLKKLKIRSLFFLIFCFFLTSNSLNAQGFPPEAQHMLDSMNRVLRTTKVDTVKVLTLTQIAGLYSDVNSDTAIVICQRIEKLSKKIGYRYGEALVYGLLGYIMTERSKIDLSLKYYNKALKLLTELHSEDGQGVMLVNIGHIYEMRGNDVKAMECFLKALKIAEKLGDNTIYIPCLHSISSIFQNQGENEKALVYLFKEVKLSKETGDKRMYAFAMSKIGNIYGHKLMKYVNENAPYDTVLQLRDNIFGYYDKSIDAFKEVYWQRGVDGCYRSIGMTYKYWADYLQKKKMGVEKIGKARQIALDYLLKGSGDDKESSNKEEYAFSLQHIGEIYLSMGKTSLAEQYAKQSFQLAKEIKAIFVLQQNANLLYRIYAKEGRSGEALKMFERSVALKDSMSNLETQKDILKKEFEYEKSKKEQENQQLKSANQIQQLSLERNRFALYGIGIIALLIIGGAVLLIRISRIRMSQRSVQLEQKLLRSQMNPHFIFNALTAIQGFVYKNEPRETGRFLSSFSILMRSILENSKEEYIPLEEEITWLENYVNLQQLRFTDGLEIQVNIDEELNLGGTFIPPMLIQPFVENAIEHGFKDKESQKLIRIDFILETDFLVISVNDNGQGFEKDKPQTQGKHISRAVQITQDRLNLLNKRKKSKIEFTIDSVPGEGTTVRFAVPLVKD